MRALLHFNFRIECTRKIYLLKDCARVSATERNYDQHGFWSNRALVRKILNFIIFSAQNTFLVTISVQVTRRFNRMLQMVLGLSKQQHPQGSSTCSINNRFASPISANNKQGKGWRLSHGPVVELRSGNFQNEMISLREERGEQRRC